MADWSEDAPIVDVPCPFGHGGVRRRLVDTIHAEGAKVFIQLFHPGREVVGRPEGVAQPAFAPSFTPAERFRVAAAPMSTDMIGEIVEGFGATAARMAEAGADGVEIVGSHGYLPLQFWSSKVNRREDRYGGSFEKRLTFAREVIAAIRGRVPKDMIVGLRMSGDEASDTDIGEEESFAVARALAPDLDYLNVIAGTSATASGALHIVPAMHIPNAYVAPFASKVKQATGKAVFVAGRINQPQIAEQVLASGHGAGCAVEGEGGWHAGVRTANVRFLRLGRHICVGAATTE